MSTKVPDWLRRQGPVPRILLAGAALSAAGLIGVGAAGAASGSSAHAGTHGSTGSIHTVVKHASTQAGTSASKPDTDNVQSGDQTGPDKKGTAEQKDGTEQKDATDTDNVQSGDQTGPDTGAQDGTGDGDNVQSGSQTGPETPDSGANG